MKQYIQQGVVKPNPRTESYAYVTYAFKKPLEKPDAYGSTVDLKQPALVVFGKGRSYLLRSARRAVAHKFPGFLGKGYTLEKIYLYPNNYIRYSEALVAAGQYWDER